MFLVISGATDGSISFWDLTDVVEGFMEYVSMLEPDKYIECQTRPRTGRGSQGGRFWKSAAQRKIQNVHGDTALTGKVANVSGDISGQTNGMAVEEHSPKKAIKSECDMKFKLTEIPPIYVLNSVHQSGVNCLSVSRIGHSQYPNMRLLYILLTGGDDQALNSIVFGVSPQSTDLMNNLSPCADADEAIAVGGQLFTCSGHKLDVFHRQTVSASHSSAVKGVWTDGNWVFSTGLDQRVRIWNIGELGKLSEYTHFIISVPEPETVDAKVCDRNRYQIAVAGRGMQMLEFAALDDEHSRESN